MMDYFWQKWQKIIQDGTGASGTNAGRGRSSLFFLILVYPTQVSVENITNKFSFGIFSKSLIADIINRYT